MVRVLIPLDGTSEAEAVFDLLKDDLNSNPEIILLQIVEPVRTVLIDGQVILGQSEEETEQTRAITYLKGLSEKYGPLNDWRCEATIYEGRADGIVKFASKENVDLVVMLQHKRNRISRLLMGSTADKVSKRSVIKVRKFTFADLN